jgi:hypothetical protein
VLTIRFERGAVGRRASLAVVCAALALLSASCRQASEAIAPPPETATRTYKKDLPGCGDRTRREEPCLTFSASWVELKSGSAPEVLARINTAVEALMHPVPDAPRSLEEEAAQFAGAYQKLKSEHAEMTQTWFDRRGADVLLNDGKIFSVSVERKHYNGGPHVEESTRLLSFRLSDGQPLQLSALLAPEAVEKFEKMAEKRLRRDRGIAPEEPFSDYAIQPQPGDFANCADIGVLPKGLLIHFDAGRIAYLAVGAIDITFPWEEMAPLLRAGTPLAHLTGR